MNTLVTAPIRQLIVFGAQSTALEIAETAADLWPYARITHVCGDSEQISDARVVRIGDVHLALVGRSGVRYIVSMVNQEVRRACHARAESLGIEPVSVIHRRAVVSRSATVGAGTYVAAHACISTNAFIAGHSMINYHSVIGHDAVLGKDVVVNPAASIGGNARIGDRSLVGANSFVLQDRTVGADVLIDAMTYVDRNVPDASIASRRRASQLQIVARPGMRRKLTKVPIRRRTLERT